MLPQLRLVAQKVSGVGQLLQHNITSTNLQQVRSAVSAFNSSNVNELWRSITIVSKNGARRGRGQKVNARLIKDLYKDQVVGEGKVKMVWPGLNTNVLRGRQLVQQERVVESEPDPNALVREAKESVRSLRKIHPLDRGFTSASICGRNLKNTTSIPFRDDFDYRVIDVRNVSHMTGLFGRYQRAAVVVACGNGNGLIGIGAGKSVRKMPAVQTASNRATARLLYIERHENRTVLHDFFSQYYATKVFVNRMPEGFGLRCHRVIALLCQLVGIKDLHAKVEGSVMPINIAKAFILGLVRQKSYDEFADEKKLHLVEFDPLRRNFPQVLASPTVCRKKSEIPTSESLDFSQLAYGGKVRFIKAPSEPFYTKQPGWHVHLKKEEKKRGYRESMHELIARHGQLTSFYGEKYPEACVKTKIYRQ